MAVAEAGAAAAHEVTAFANAGYTTPAYTVDAAANLLLLFVHWPSGFTEYITSDPVWNGSETMTLIGTIENGDGFNVSVYRLVNPTTGSHTASIVGLASSTGGIVGFAACSGVDPTTPVAGLASSQSTASSSPSGTTTAASAAADDLTIDALTTGWNTTVTDDGSPSTQLYNQGETTIGFAKGGVSKETGTGTITANWTHSGTIEKAHVVFILKAAAGGGGATHPGADGCGVFHHDPMLDDWNRATRRRELVAQRAGREVMRRDLDLGRRAA